MPNKVKMIADAKICQDGEWIARGRQFQCTEGDAADLEAMGMAHRDSIVDAVKRQYRRRDMTAQ